MPGVIDTNLLLYAVNTAAEENDAPRAFLPRAAHSVDQWYISEGGLYEFFRVATHPRVFPHPLTWRQALAFLKPMLACPRFGILSAGDNPWEVLETLLSGLTHPSGNLFFDIRTVALMKEHGIRKIYTADTDFLQFQDIEVINPLRPL